MRVCCNLLLLDRPRLASSGLGGVFKQSATEGSGLRIPHNQPLSSASDVDASDEIVALVQDTALTSSDLPSLRERRTKTKRRRAPESDTIGAHDDDRGQARLATPPQQINKMQPGKQQHGTPRRASAARVSGRFSDPLGGMKAPPGTTGNPDAVNATLNQDRVNQRVSRIYPLTDSVYVAQTKKTPVEVKFHPVTSHFVNEPRLEKLYEVTFARENCPRSSRISGIFLVLYMIFTGSNLSNLFSSDEKVRAQSMDYFQMVWISIVPVPFLIYLSRRRKYEVQFQRIYSVVVLCWSFSMIAGGMFSMLTEWYSYVSKDIDILMDAIKISNSTSTIYYVNSTMNPEWQFKPIAGSQIEVLKSYTSEVLLPSATMNINMLRLMLVFVFVPLLRIDTAHFAFIAFVTCLSYMVLTFIYYPVTDSTPFITNRILVICFPIMFALVMLMRNRDVDRVIRQDFLHVWAVELEAEKATREKNLIAEENRNLKKELAQRDNDFSLDLTSPLHSLLAELKSFIDDTDMSDEATNRGMAILRNLAKLDTNLFMPDISAQMKSEKEVDNDTKNWALSVLARKDYSGARRTEATMSLSSHSNSDTRRNIHDGPNNTGSTQTTVAPLLTMPSWEDDALNTVKHRIETDGWDLDTIKIAEITGNRPLMYVTAAMFEIHELHEEFRIDRIVLRNFLFMLDEGYLENPYHNSSHAADVVNSVNYLITGLSDGQIRDSLTNLEFYAALVAAAIHDFRHPGKSNNYLIKAKHDLAVQYNDRSILESMHVAETFFIMRNPLCDIFGRMKDKPYREIRKAIIEMVLSTDLSMHLQLVGNLKALMLQDANAGNNNATSRAVTDPMMIMKVVIKCADIGHAAKERKLHVLWSSLIIEEFFLQGDDERANNSDISPFMDRHSENSAKVRRRLEARVDCVLLFALPSLEVARRLADPCPRVFSMSCRTKSASSSSSYCLSTRRSRKSSSTRTSPRSTASPSKTTACGRSPIGGSSPPLSRSETRCS